MIKFENKKYELLFSNKLPPLIALNYADELFFKEFKKLCGVRYRILSIIKRGWQNKYGLDQDIRLLEKNFENKINDTQWAQKILKGYLKKSKELRIFLKKISKIKYASKKNSEIIKQIKKIRRDSAQLDAMSNILHLFSSLIGERFYFHLSSYTSNRIILNKNFIFYTQPIIESRLAKIKIKNLPRNEKIRLKKIDDNLSNILRTGAFIKDDVSEMLDLRKKMTAGIFKEIAKRLKCGEENLEYLQIKEIEKFLKIGKVDKDLIKGRKNITVLFYKYNNLEIFEGNAAKEKVEKGKFTEFNEIKAGKILKGQVASLGRAQGKVVLAINSGEANRKMARGNVLVAPYTAVEYVNAMKKAVAIITETGGITSHAAIMSREFGIPCIIGIKNVTKILKDGDLVEVDADKGIVRIMK